VTPVRERGPPEGLADPRTAGTAALNCRHGVGVCVTREVDSTELDGYLSREAGAVEAALVDRDRSRLADAPGGPDAVVEHLFTDAFVGANTDFPSFESFLEHAGTDSVWALSRWIDWVLDWHVLGNTRFWSWEWMVNAAVELARDAAGVGPARCQCGGRPVPVTGSAVEEPGRVDETWVRFACDCGGAGRITLTHPDGEVRTEGNVDSLGPDERLLRPVAEDREDRP
jgi:hypothetical protein